MKIRSILAVFAAGLLFLAFSLLPLIGLIFHPAVPSFLGTSNGFLRSFIAERTVQESLRVDEGGVLRARSGAAMPAWLELVAVSVDGLVLVSNVESFPVGSLADAGRLEAFAARATLDERSISQSITREGRLLGSYVARYRSFPLVLGQDPARPLMASVYFLATSGLALGLSWILGARLASSLGRLKKAARRIAGGDLEGRVESRGSAEIRSLAAAMEEMRQALLEDRARRARFLAAISHDLRTPLTSVKGYIEAIQDGLAADPGTLERYVSIMRAKAQDLESRIGELLAFARMDTGEWRATLAPLELCPWLEAILRPYAEEARDSGRALESHLESLEGLSVMADPGLLKRAFENILSNALRYAPPGSAVKVQAERGPAGIRLIVSDRGPGMPEAEIERVFEPYFRGSNRKGEGLGLGLSIARSILSDHGFSVRAENDPAGGCRFVIGLAPK
jgi:signal transduction histidine kinase